MYTAKIKSKEFVNGALKVTVDYSDGVTTVTESCIPQDFDGLKFWVKSRLTTFNSGKEIDTAYATDDVIDTTPVVETRTPTKKEIDRENWLGNYYKWLKVKTTLIDTGVLTGNETKAVALLNKVKTDFLPEYIDSI